MLFCFLRLIFFFRGSISMFYKFWGCFFSISEYCNPIKLICDKLVPFLHVLLKFLNVLVQFQLADLYLGLIKIHLSFRNLNLRIKEGLMIQIEDIFTAKCTFLLITGCCVSLLFFHKIRSELHIFQYIYQLPVLYNQDVKIILVYFWHKRSSHQRCSIRKAVLKNFAILTGKHLCWSLF